MPLYDLLALLILFFSLSCWHVSLCDTTLLVPTLSWWLSNLGRCIVWGKLECDAKQENRWTRCIHSETNKSGWYFTDSLLKMFFLSENCCILITISLQCVNRSPHDNRLTLIQVMAWCCTGTKPLPDPMLIQIIDTYMHHRLQYIKGVQCVKSGWNKVGLD